MFTRELNHLQTIDQPNPNLIEPITHPPTHTNDQTQASRARTQENRTHRQWAIQKTQSIAEYPNQRNQKYNQLLNTHTRKKMNRVRRGGKMKKKKTNRRTQCKETERKQKLAQRRGRNHTSSNTKNDPKPAHEPASWPDRAVVSQTARRSLCQKRRNRAETWN